MSYLTNFSHYQQQLAAPESLDMNDQVRAPRFRMAVTQTSWLDSWNPQRVLERHHKTHKEPTMVPDAAATTVVS